MSMTSKSVVEGNGRIQVSIEKSWFEEKLSDGAFETMIRSSIPSRLNAWPTTPLVKLTPFSSVALLALTESLPLPSARHQLIMVEGAGIQLVGLDCVHLPAPAAL